MTLYWHRSPDRAQALLHATPSIVNDCLYVGEHVVIWHESDIDTAQSLVATLHAQEPVPEIALGGGEYPTDLELTSSIRERCETELIWFAGAVQY